MQPSKIWSTIPPNAEGSTSDCDGSVMGELGTRLLVLRCADASDFVLAQKLSDFVEAASKCTEEPAAGLGADINKGEWRRASD